jgi:phosphatidylglycerol:prolipoprotein diacylglycerol transferase
MYPILCRYSGITVFSYGVFLLAGFALGFWLGGREMRRIGVPPKTYRDLALVVLVASLVGARLLYLAVEWRFFSGNPVSVLEVWRGGLVFFGGLAAALLAGGMYLRAKRIAPLPILDALAPAVAAGHAVGRIGCFLTGCCYGAASHLPWAVTFTDPRGLAPTGVPLHPSQLYDGLGNAALSLLLLWLLGRGSLAPGRVTGVYLTLYSGLRFAVEFTRGDPRGALGVLSTGQVFAAVFFAAGCWLFFRREKTNAFRFTTPGR